MDRDQADPLQPGDFPLPEDVADEALRDLPPGVFVEGGVVWEPHIQPQPLPPHLGQPLIPAELPADPPQQVPQPPGLGQPAAQPGQPGQAAQPAGPPPQPAPPPQPGQPLIPGLPVPPPQPGPGQPVLPAPAPGPQPPQPPPVQPQPGQQQPQATFNHRKPAVYDGKKPEGFGPWLSQFQESARVQNWGVEPGVLDSVPLYLEGIAFEAHSGIPPKTELPGQR